MGIDTIYRRSLLANELVDESLEIDTIYRRNLRANKIVDESFRGWG